MTGWDDPAFFGDRWAGWQRRPYGPGSKDHISVYRPAG